MIKRIGMFALIAASVVLPLNNSVAAESAADKKKIQKYTRQLKRLPNVASPAGKIQSLVKKLSKLRPGKTDQYYKIGLRKLGLSGVQAAAFARRLNQVLRRSVDRSDLSAKAIQQMVRRLNKTLRLYVPPSPTPPPYQAMALPEGAAMRAA